MPSNLVKLTIEIDEKENIFVTCNWRQPQGVEDAVYLSRILAILMLIFNDPTVWLPYVQEAIKKYATDTKEANVARTADLLFEEMSQQHTERPVIRPSEVFTKSIYGEAPRS
jgi:hypothetical protein